MEGLRFSTALLVILPLLALVPRSVAKAAEAGDEAHAIEFFEKEVRPVLVERCLKCHGPEKQWAGLRLDSRDALLKGGDSGPALTPGDADASELLKRLTEADDSLRMPPEDDGDRLTPRQVEAIAEWIRRGAAWPASGDDNAKKADPFQHWAFQPVRRPELPEVSRPEWCETPVDRFILAGLDAAGLAPSTEADRRTLIRRATYDLTGLPPTPEEVDAFVADDSSDAYERLVDRLLSSPRYGEHWGRHWLDVARYSDTKGYVYAREERFFVHSSVYRDWVVEAFNADLPYDRFVTLQLAADQVAPDEAAAMGYLTLGRRFIGVMPDIIDDRIDVVTRGLMGLTVGCARCHDHKYDPIPTADYYALYGIFQNCAERLTPLPNPEAGSPAAAEFLKGLQERGQKLTEATVAKRAEAGERIRKRIADYLSAQRELQKYPIMGFDVIIAADDLVPATVRRWQAYLATAAAKSDPAWAPWAAFARLKEDEFSGAAADITQQLSREEINPRVAAAFAAPPATPREVAERYARVFSEIDAEWRTILAAAERDGRPAPTVLADPAAEALRQVLYGPGSPCVIPDEPIVNTETLYDSGTVNELWKLQGEVDRWLIRSPELAPHAVILTDRDYNTPAHVFRRGNPAERGAEVPPHAPTLLGDRPPVSQGSGRRELAQAIVDPANPLTARVWVNRVWAHHFGAGLVRTPSDFGLRSEPPSHPELLDWLTDEFTKNGWNTKALHRAIVLSATYRQRSDDSTPATETAQSADPENRLLSRMNPRRLGYEELRDTLAALSGRLDSRMGGKAVDQFPAEGSPVRRTIYGLIDRQFVPGVMRMFDFANPDLHAPQRSETTVPQQALFALNHPFVASQTRALANHLDGPNNAGKVRNLYRATFQREPTTAERDLALGFLAAARAEERSPTSLAWSYGYGEFDEAAARLKGFQPLPHFDGSAWQGGPQFPDATLGWVQLTAQGGHPGNEPTHASVRRWTAPRDGVIAIRSVVTHEPEVGDGIRCRIVSDRQGALATALVHHTQQPMNLDRIEVKAGETIDFVTDRYENLNSDQFLWSAEVRFLDPPPGDAPTAWNSEADFSGPATTLLGPWEQLAQVLLVSNELLFVD